MSYYNGTLNEDLSAVGKLIICISSYVNAAQWE